MLEVRLADSERLQPILHLVAEDPVIFHCFALELKAVFDRISAEPDRPWAALIPGSFAGSWRHRLLEGLLPVFTDPAQLPDQHQLIPLGPQQLDALSEEQWLVAPHTFRAYSPSARYRGMVARIQHHHGVLPGKPQDCVLVQRSGSRQLRALETGELLEQWLEPHLHRAAIPWRVVVLEELDPLEQWRVLASARLLVGAHGSGLTNLVFTPEGCQVLEIGFHNQWSCDPLCDLHRGGSLAPGQPCQADPPAYRKADYHNLAALFARPYQVLPAAAVSGYRSSNPIDVDQVLVSGSTLLRRIASCFHAGSQSASGRRPDIAVLSSFYGTPPWSKDSLSNHLAYCLRHGYTYLPALKRQLLQRHHSWERVDRLRALIRAGRFDAVFWMDGDSWFFDPDTPLEAFLEASDASIQFTGDQSDVINTGHLLLRSDPPALAFLDAWWQIHHHPDVRLPTSHYHEGCLMDGPAAIALLGGADPAHPETWREGFNAVNGCPGNASRRLRQFQDTHHPFDPERARRAHAAICDRWRSHCFVWPQGRLNAYPWALQPGDFIVHFVGDQAKPWMERCRDQVMRYPAGGSRMG